MKILLVNQVFYPDLAATAQHSLDLALDMRRRGCEVTVVCDWRGYENRKLKYPRRENYRGIEIHRIFSTGFGKFRFLFRVIDSLSFEFVLFWKLLRLPRHDLMIGFTSPPLVGFIGVLACMIRGGRYVNWLMDLNPDVAIAVGYFRDDSWIAKFLRGAFRFSLLKSQACVVLDRWMQERIEKYGFPRSKITVIPPWPVHEMKVPEIPREKNAFRFQYKLENKFILLYSGNHSIVHPVRTLLEAAKLLRDDSNIQFVFAGGGLRVSEVTQFKKEHGLTNILQLPHQPRERLHEALALADLHVVIMGEAVNGLVHTSKIYGILATGKPYVALAPNQSHLGDLLKECPYGFQVEHGQPQEMVAVIRKAQKLSAEELAIFNRENRRWVEANCSYERAMRTFARRILNLDEDEKAIVPDVALNR